MIVVEFPMLPPWIAYTNVPQPALPKPLPIAGTNISLPVNVYTVCPCSGCCTACTAAPQQEGHGFDSRVGRCWLWGAGPPQTFSVQVGYLLGLSVWSL